MAKLAGLPPAGVIRALKGKVDFYVQNGQVLARKWPVITKSTVTEKVLAYNRRFSYAMKVARALPKTIVYCWWAMSLNTHWSWRDVFYRNYSGAADGSTAPKFPLTKPHFPFPDLRSRYWVCYLAGYLFERTGITLVFWTDTLFPSVQLVAQDGLNYSEDHIKFRRGLEVHCGRDLLPDPRRTVHKLTSPGVFFDPSPNSDYPGIDNAGHSASLFIGDPFNGMLPPFDSGDKMMTLRYEQDDCSMPGILRPYSASFWFLFDWEDLADRWGYFWYFSGVDEAFAPVMPPDPFWRTRLLYTPEQLQKRGWRYNPPAYPRASILNYADSEDLRPQGMQLSPCGLYEYDLDYLVTCHLTTLPPVPCVHHSRIWRRHTRVRSGSAWVSALGNPPSERYPSRAEDGDHIYHFFGVGFPSGCQPGLLAYVWADQLNDPAESPSPPANVWQGHVHMSYPSDHHDSGTFNITEDWPQTIVEPSDPLFAQPANPPVALTPALQYAHWRMDTADPWNCPNRVSWTDTVVPTTCEIFIATLAEKPFHDSDAPSYQFIGSGTYATPSGNVVYWYWLPRALDYFGLGGSGVPYDPAGPVQSLLSDPTLLSLGFHYP